MSTFDINTSWIYDAIEFDFKTISEYSNSVEVFLEREYHEHIELRPIEEIKVVETDTPNFSAEKRREYEDHLNQQLADEFSESHERLTHYFPNLQRSTALTAIVSFSEIWVRKIGIAVQNSERLKASWKGEPIDNGANIGKCISALKANGIVAAINKQQLDQWMNIKEVRNFFVHQNGSLSDTENNMYEERDYKSANADQKLLLRALTFECQQNRVSKLGRQFVINRTFIPHAVTIALSAVKKLLDSACKFSPVLPL